MLFAYQQTRLTQSSAYAYAGIEPDDLLSALTTFLLDTNYLHELVPGADIKVSLLRLLRHAEQRRTTGPLAKARMQCFESPGHNCI